MDTIQVVAKYLTRKFHPIHEAEILFEAKTKGKKEICWGSLWAEKSTGDDYCEGCDFNRHQTTKVPIPKGNTVWVDDVSGTALCTKCARKDHTEPKGPWNKE